MQEKAAAGREENRRQGRKRQEKMTGKEKRGQEMIQCTILCKCVITSFSKYAVQEQWRQTGRHELPKCGNAALPVVTGSPLRSIRPPVQHLLVSPVLREGTSLPRRLLPPLSVCPATSPCSNLAYPLPQEGTPLSERTATSRMRGKEHSAMPVPTFPLPDASRQDSGISFS